METWHVLDLELEAHHPQVLRSDDETRVVAIFLPAGEQMQEHQVHERSYLIVVDGDVTISQESGSVSGGAGLLAHFGPGERRTIEATTDARLVLLLAPWPGEGHPSRALGA
jgi:quercetin dioxygenase-like cupin family protein